MQETPTRHRVGLIGTGYIGRRNGAAIQKHDATQVAAICDPSDQARDAATDTLNVPSEAKYSAVEQMLAGVELDAVVISSPPASHTEHIAAAAEAGIDILCEKPLCTTVSDAKRIVQIDEEYDVLIRVGFQRRAQPVYRTAKEELSQDTITSFSAEIVDDWLPVFEGTWRVNPEISGGGQLFDTGSHLVDLVAWITHSEPHAVSAQMRYLDKESKVDTAASLTLELTDGTVGSLNVVGDTPRPREHIHVWDESIGVDIHAKEWEEESVTFIDTDGTERVPHFPDQESNHKIRAFISAVTGHDSEDTLAHVRDGARVVTTLRAAYEAARSGNHVEIDRWW